MAISLYNDSIQYDTTTITYNGSAVTSISINGIHGQNFSSGTEELIVVWNNHPVIYNSTTGWEFQPVTLTTDTDVYFDSFLDHAFMVNGTDSNYSYDGTSWSTTTNLNNSPISKFIKEHKTRLYLYNVKLSTIATKPSWCWFSDLPKNGQITWGIEYGADLAQTAASAVVTSAGSTFTTNNIKVGDPFVITTGDNAGEYYVQSIDSETQITLTETLASNDTNCSFWVGGNYFEVSTEDGDVGNGMAETSNELFLFKKNSLYRYNSTAKELRKVKTAPGTTSPRSIVESGGYVYWYHPSGIYRTSGAQEELISNAIYDAIEGVDANYQTIICGWRNEIKKTVNMYLGPVTLRDGTMINHCVATFDENSQIWSLKSYGTRIKVATNWLESNVPKIYAGDNERTIYKLEYGNNYDGNPIPFDLETQPIYPAGTEKVINFDSVWFYISNGPDVQIMYKLLYKPTFKDNQWINDTDWKPMKGSQRGDRSEWRFPTTARASGIKFKIVESSTNESFLLEKLTINYSHVRGE